MKYNLSCRTGFAIGLFVASAYFELLSGTRTIRAVTSLHRVEITLESSAAVEPSQQKVDLQLYEPGIPCTTAKEDNETVLQQESDSTLQLEADIVEPEKLERDLVPLQQQVEGVVLDPHSVWDHGKLVFIHIGKSGGSSARCMLETNLGEGTCKDGKFLQSLNFRDEYTAIYNRTVALCHQLSCVANQQWRIDHPKAAKPADWSVMNFPGVIVSVRNPVYRVLSWYLYGRMIYQTGKFESGDNMQVYLCYPEFADAADAIRSWVENEVQPASNHTDYTLMVNKHTNHTEAACQDFARKCVDGSIACSSDHNWQNYRYYLKSVLDPAKPTPVLYVARNEYKWEDFYTINLLLGGTATSYHPLAIKLPPARKMQGDRRIPTATRPALCRILCDEIHIYEATLRQAVNLHDLQIQQSLQEVDDSCHAKVVDLCGRNPYLLE